MTPEEIARTICKSYFKELNQPDYIRKYTPGNIRKCTEEEYFNNNKEYFIGLATNYLELNAILEKTE